MSAPGTAPHQDPVISLADTEDDAYAGARLDQGYSPNEREVRVGRFGMTADEELAGESLEERLAEEEPDPAASLVLDGSDGDVEGELLDDEVGDARAGRLVEPDAGAGTDTEASAVADDVGLDGGAASAEEAAVHVVRDGPAF